jgi:phospholipid transport system substrate-binding protein
MIPNRLAVRLLLVLSFVVAVQVPLAAGATADPTQFMMQLGDRVLKIINQKPLSEAERKTEFRMLAEQSFDIPKIARFVLGRYWRTASEEEKQHFRDAFENYMIQVYWSRFNSYHGETFKVLAARDEGNGTTLVTTLINRPETGQPPVKVNWALVQDGNSYKIRDASLEGVSQALTYRDEFSSIIERNGGKVSALINQLNQRAQG